MFSNDNDGNSNVNDNDTQQKHKSLNLIFDSLPKNQLKLIDNVR